jgi:hypothetical protein
MLDNLADYFKSSSAGPMPDSLSKFWNNIVQSAKTAKQKRIIRAFKTNPTELNKQKLVAILWELWSKKRAEFKSWTGNSNRSFPDIVSDYEVSYERLSNAIKPARGKGYRRRPMKKAAAKKKTGKIIKAQKQAAGSGSVRLYTRTALDKQLVVKKASTVNVTLSREEMTAIAGKLNKTMSARVSTKKKLRVQIKPILNCQTKGEHTYTIPLPAEGKPTSLPFTIVPTHMGKAKFSVDVWQGYELACSMELEAGVVLKKAAAGRQQKQVFNNATGRLKKKINQLRISERQVGKQFRYDYEVSFGDIDEWNDFQSPPINSGTANFISKLYKKIEQLYDDAAGNNAEFNVKLKRLGASLFLSLFPPDLQQLFYKNRKKLTSIQIVSNEPNIPWEMMVIRNPDKKKPTKQSDPFFAELGIIRWIKRGSFPMDKLQCRANRSRFVIPAYQDTKRVLPAAEKEIALLKNTFRAKQVPATTKEVELLLESGRFDLLHFCCHGEGDNNRIIGARLVLQEIRKNGNWKPTYLEQIFVEQNGSFIRNGSPQPIVVLNGCRTGILGKKLVGYGGFAKAFIEAGAGVFVGGLWALEDEAAYNFVDSFYKNLKKGMNLSDATIKARQQSKAALNPTWLSYVVYGNPFAKLVQ